MSTVGYDPTIVDDCCLAIRYRGQKYMVLILDTGGHPEYSTRSLTDNYLRTTDGFLLVYDIASRTSFSEEAKNCYNKLLKVRQQINEPFNLVLVGNKLDSPNREVPHILAKKIANKWSCPFFEVSALKNINVRDAFLRLIKITIDRVNQQSLVKKPPPVCSIL
eukprot:TRINITY_DN9219_c0_g1_i1.p1 TRINITY_DN9219_c0_g1~~TRINITY_DN9219_c0_g1_i1.p1  ORF type:complete len:163 (+),score=11.54 TRINITY_DN9219_c0_g1_i1:351-839(+)